MSSKQELVEIHEKGYAQTVTSKTGNRQQGQGYAQLKGRAMLKTYEKGYAQKVTNIHKQYGVYFVCHPLPGFELGTFQAPI